jgi:hypothetical protein
MNFIGRRFRNYRIKTAFCIKSSKKKISFYTLKTIITIFILDYNYKNNKTNSSYLGLIKN